jgi:hypothetical protein
MLFMFLAPAVVGRYLDKKKNPNPKASLRKAAIAFFALVAVFLAYHVANDDPNFYQQLGVGIASRLMGVATLCCYSPRAHKPHERSSILRLLFLSRSIA